MERRYHGFWDAAMMSHILETEYESNKNKEYITFDINPWIHGIILFFRMIFDFSIFQLIKIARII